MSETAYLNIAKINPLKSSKAVYSVGDTNDGSSIYAIAENEDISRLSAYSISMMERYNVPKDEASLLDAYRELAKTSDVDEAIKEIVNETFSGDGSKEAFRPMFKPDTKLSSETQKKIQECFEYVYHKLLDFDKNGKEYFRQWYVDGKFIFHIAVDDTEKTIRYLQPIDPKYCRRVKFVSFNKDTGLINKEKTKFYYYYIPPNKITNDNIRMLWSSNYNANVMVRFEDNSIAYSDSGLIDQEKNLVLSNLYKAIQPFNNLKMMEEAMVIYRIVRAPEKRAFYIDVGGMGNAKAMEHINYVKNMFNNKTTFDSSTNSFINRKTIHSMVEDYYLPRRDGQKGTEIQTLGGAENLGVTKDIEYLKDKFYRALNVPIGRLDAEMQNSTLLLGRVTEMQRDEYRFKRFIDTLRSQFIPLIEKILLTELLLRNIVTMESWYKDVNNDLYWDYTEDNSFTELKNQEKIRAKIELLDACTPHIGTYFSKTWIMKNVLNMTDAEIEDMQKEIEKDGSKEQDDNGGGFSQYYANDSRRSTTGGGSGEYDTGGDDHDYSSYTSTIKTSSASLY